MSVAEAVTHEKLLHVDSSGEGPAVVLLHGWGMHGGYWQGLVDDLKSSYRLHCIDLPGHGKSEYGDEQSIDDFVNRITQTIDTLTDQAFHLIGWSLGGLISQRLTVMYPDKVKALALIASTPSFVQRDDWPHAMQESVLCGFADNLRQDYKMTLNRFLALQVWGCENQKQELRDLKAKLFSRGEPSQQALSTGLLLLKDVDLRNDLSTIEQQVMLVGGGRDTLVPRSALQAMASKLKQGDLHIIKGAGHAPLLSHAAEMASLIKTFMAYD